MALAEQGAKLTGIDIMPEAIEMTRLRLRCFGLDEPQLQAMNATEIDTHFEHHGFDLVIFFDITRAHDTQRAYDQSPGSLATAGE